MRRILLTGIAAIVVAAAPSLAQDKDKGGGKGGGNATQGPQTAKPGKGGEQRGNSGQRVERSNDDARSVAPARALGERGSDNRGGGNEDRAQRANEDRGRGNADRAVVVDRGSDNGGGRFDDDFRLRDAFATNSRGLINGCPPGLAAKNNGCRPPGLARQQDQAWRQSLYRPDWWGLSSLGSGRYLYDDGYLYRLNDTGVVAGFIPLLGGALGIGNPWPAFYEPVPLPAYYQDYYGLGSPDRYRLADNVIYGVDPESAAITSIAALLTGDQFAVGQPLPLGYDVYNVPYAYRDRYYDTPDSLYRYSDGYIYQVDPETRLISSVIELLT